MTHTTPRAPSPRGLLVDGRAAAAKLLRQHREGLSRGVLLVRIRDTKRQGWQRATPSLQP